MRWSFRAHRRRLSLGLSTLFGLSRRGYFIPYRYADVSASAPTADRFPTVAGFIRNAEPSMIEILSAMDRFAADLKAIAGDHPPEPRWNQNWFPRLDAAAAYVMTRIRHPARIVEIGAGHSSRFFARAIRDGGLATVHAAIDPSPRAVLGELNIVLHQETIQEAGLEPMLELAGGDVLSIDSSHILMPGSDVDILLSDILPQLSAGTLVHIHDIFLPDPYPSDWEWRGYNEQHAVAALIGAGGWRILWSSHHVASVLAEECLGSVVARLPINPGAHESSLWLEKLPDVPASV